MESEHMHIRIKASLQIIGKPKEYIEETIKNYIKNIKENETLILIGEKTADAIEKDKIWSTYSEIELVVKGVSNLVDFCIEYMPASIEIIKPETFAFEDRIFTRMINEILNKLHNVDMIAKTLGTENKFLKKNMAGLIRNSLLILVKFGINDLEKMTKTMGIEANELRVFINQLIEEKRIKEENGNYFVA